MKNIVITMGDPAGVGPEIILKYMSKFNEYKKDNLKIVISGSIEILKKTSEKMGIQIGIEEFKNFEQVDNSKIYVIDSKLECRDLIIAQPSFLSGKLSMDYLDNALKYVMGGLADAVVTAPISKDAINMAGYNYSGHTEYLAEKTNTKDFGMVLKGNKITVVLNSTHISLKEAIEKVTEESVLQKIILANTAKKELGIKGKIAVAGLNPHNGENGLFGNEEQEKIVPAIKRALEMGIDVEGPIVPDTLFVKMMRDVYNIAVVMYHDQGLIPMKMESFGNGVNITVGLPIVRTSVDHGTAFDIAGTGIADEGSLEKAVETAVNIVKNRKGD